MTKPDPLARFSTDLVRRLAARDHVPEGQPMTLSPWLAMSLLQKAVRRGRSDLALRAAATLLRDAPDRLWRRLGVIAFEDVGLGSLPTLGLTVAALRGKRFRLAIGGDWPVASLIVTELCAARKSRAADELLMGIETLSHLAEQRRDLACMTNACLRLLALTTTDLHQRALALTYILGTDRPGHPLPAHRGEAALAVDLLDELGVAPTTLAICRECVKKTGEALPLLVALLALENGLRADPTDDPMPPEVLIGDLPGWALDQFTREGKAALTRLAATTSGVAAMTAALVPKPERVRLLGRLLFRVEGSLLTNRVGGDLSDRLHAQQTFETLGVDPRHAAQALDLMREDLPLLNCIRAAVLKEANHG
ncbi:hypothetical protein GLS40_08030 [Pseudooceanicola sp. 216_PA32_1]|uniref:DUF2336 domain-containing protein n=1 Tax=Pseudooceanicola pacificus TaxID=2676438 RepID=A0A844W2F8_9RHOB|nr:hypothetical protein [Pseudooceanicola pacificus]MWB77967.1 hypothetical protein [Pseudooceanicola pacificus]